MKTYAPKPSDIERRWYVIDASGAVLGRLASEVAQILKGKHKPIYAPHADTGDHVIIVNASGVVLTGGKETKKIAYRHSGYPGGLSETRYDRLLAERPAYAVEKAVRGMLPKNSLGRSMLRKLQVYAGPEHPHEAQKPESLTLGRIPVWNGLPKPAEKSKKTKPEPSKPAAKRVSARTSAAKAPAVKKSAAKKPATAPKKAAEGRTAKTATQAEPAKKRTTRKKAEE